MGNGNPAAPICSDCHTTHDVDRPKLDAIKLAITRNCGTCHAESLKSYTNTYHGQVNTLGYAYTAKCFDCHGSHGIQRVSHPQSTVHRNNRLQTCQKCHKDATPGFITFQPHANTHDFGRYPYMWIASKFMIALLLGVFAFFWTHSALWFYREYQDRQEGKSAPHVVTGELPQLQGKHFQRFGAGVADRPPCLRAERDDAGADRHGGAVRRNRLGEVHRRRAGRPASGGHRAPG